MSEVKPPESAQPQANAEPAQPAAPAEPAAAPKDSAAPAANNDPKPPAAPAAPVVPEKYDLKLPDGSPLDASHIEKVSSFAKENGLSNEKAQQLLERESKVVAEHQAAQIEQLKAQSVKWKEQMASDKEIGGDEFPKNVELSKRVLTRYAEPDFVKMLDDTGLGNHPELVRIFARIGKNLSDDQLVMPGAQGPAPKSLADAFYSTEN